MQSAAAIIPAINAGTNRCAFAPPMAFKVRVGATGSARGARCACAIVGAKPAHDTRSGSCREGRLSLAVFCLVGRVFACSGPLS
jgi:hypothetical protein